MCWLPGCYRFPSVIFLDIPPGLTTSLFPGFETAPTYIEVIDPNAYGPLLRNLLFCSLFLNAPLMLMVYAVLPEQTINAGINILSILAEIVAGRWLRILIVVDAVLVLAGGVIGGICSVCALLDRLAKFVGSFNSFRAALTQIDGFRDQVISERLLMTLPVTGAQYILIILCFALNILLYVLSCFSLETVSAVFTVTVLSTLLLVRAESAPQ